MGRANATVPCLPDAAPATSAAKLQVNNLRIELAVTRGRAEAAVGIGDDALAPDNVGKFHDALGDQRGMLDIVGRGIDHARQQQLVVGQCDILPDRPLMRVTRIGCFERDALRPHAKHDLDDLGEIDVVRVRALIIAPADMNADPIRGDAVKRMVERLDMKRRAL